MQLKGNGPGNWHVLNSGKTGPAVGFDYHSVWCVGVQSQLHVIHADSVVTSGLPAVCKRMRNLEDFLFGVEMCRLRAALLTYYH